MRFRFAGKKISSLVTALPPREVRFEDEMDNYGFSRQKSMKLKTVMGFDRHRLADPGVCASDLCLFGLEYLLAHAALRRDEVDALILVTQTPDHLLPPTSNLIQGRAGLGRDTLCMDINQGCAGFIVGLFQAFLLLETGVAKKVVVLNGDTLSHRVSPRDRNTFPIVGDAASAALVENDPDGPPVHGVIHMDGSGAKALIVPAGGARIPNSPETAVETDAGDGNFRSLNHFCMDGAAVFNFVQIEVPPMIDELLTFADCPRESVESFLFHQPNKFMLEKLADAMRVPREKVPNNVVTHFGNGSSVTIPTNICFNFGERLKKEKLRMCLGGFGVGLTWGGIVMDLGPMNVCDLVDYAP